MSAPLLPLQPLFFFVFCFEVLGIISPCSALGQIEESTNSKLAQSTSTQLTFPVPERGNELNLKPWKTEGQSSSDPSTVAFFFFQFDLIFARPWKLLDPGGIMCSLGQYKL